jgi:hypothetical protein
VIRPVAVERAEIERIRRSPATDDTSEPSTEEVMAA